jgi:hypothetical protein
MLQWKGNKLEETHAYLLSSYLAPTIPTPWTITAPSLPLLSFFFMCIYLYVADKEYNVSEGPVRIQ